MVSENIFKAQKKLCYNDIDEIPKNKVGLLLGTSKYIGKSLNYYYKYRIDAAVELYKKGKIKYILVSGDNSAASYNEPQTFKDDLVKRGIPAKRIYLDYAGFRTFDSVIRSKEVFGQESITFISQQFHNERAIFIAKHNGINAVGYNAKDLHGRNGLKTRIRERFARIKAILDVFILCTKPKFLGEKIIIE
ncbi:MAG: YdcF family protein [Bacteroidales bacterium]|nr:YdcF family protein [Bacteroidales bacterium]